jgi:surface protein
MATEFINGQWRIPNSWNVDESNQGKVSNYSMKFNGTSDSVNVGVSPPPLNTSFQKASFSLWAKTTAWGTPSSGFTLFNNRPNAYSGIALNTFTSRMYLYPKGMASNISFNMSNSGFIDDEWNHIAISIDSTKPVATDRIKIYINGVSATLTGVITLNSTFLQSAANFTIGSGLRGFYDGEIDMFCMFDYALSASQVSTLYGNNSAGYFQIGNPMALTPNPVAFYPLGDQDLIGAGYNGANWLVPNQVATSLSSYVFKTATATSSYFNIPSITISSVATISIWVNIEFFTSSNAQVLFGGAGSSRISINKEGLVVRIVNYDGTNLGLKITTLLAADFINKWHHIALVQNNGAGTLYIDGVDEGTLSGVLVTPTYTNIAAINTGQFGINGLISNAALFSINLPPTGTESIASLYNNGTPPNLNSYSSLERWYKLNDQDTFNSGTSIWTIKDYADSQDGTSLGMTSANLVSSNLPNAAAGYSPYAIELNGTDQNFDLGTSLSLANELTISSWININNTTAGAKVIVYKGSNSSYEFGLEVNRTSGKLSTLGASTGPVFTSNTTLAAGVWYHAALTKTIVGATITYTFFLNGQPDGTGTTTVAPNYTSGITAIGKFGSSSGGYFNGKISNLALWNSGLSSSQIDTIYNNGIPGDISSLNPLAWWELGSMMGFNGSDTYTALSNTDSNFAAVSTSNMAAVDLVNGPGYSNGGSGTSSLVIEKQAPYSFNNALSESMAISNRDDSQVSDPYPLMIELDLTGETSSYTFTTPILYTSGDISIDWGDGSAIQQTGTISNTILTHVYDTDTYPRPLIQWGRSTDAGKISRFLVNAGASRLNISNLKQWGKSFNGVSINFSNAANMIITAQDIPDLSNTSLASMFLRCSSITTIPNIEKWDVSNKAVSAAQMFRFCSNFIATDLDNFADNVFDNQAAMFGDCTSLNSASFSKWRTKGSMSEAFEGMSSLDQDLSTKTVTRADGSTYIAWDISECTSLFQMLDYNSGFTGTNPNISNWDTSNLVGAGLGYLFLQAKMNNDISTKQISTPNPYNTTYTAWDVSGVTNFISFSQSNSIFNQNLRTWQLNESTTSLNQIFTSTLAFSDDNYTDTLVGWAVYLYGTDTPPENLSLGNTSGLIFQDNRTVNSDDNGSTTTNYSSLYPSLFPATWTQAGDAREYLVETLGWSSTGTSPL